MSEPERNQREDQADQEEPQDSPLAQQNSPSEPSGSRESIREPEEPEEPQKPAKEKYIPYRARQWEGMKPIYDRGSRLTEEQREMRKQGLCAAMRRGYDNSPCRNLEAECLRHCGRLSAQSGLVCCLAPVVGRHRCKWHGGRANVGMNNHSAKDLKYSKHLPKELQTRFETALQDPELISMREDLAILTVRIQELISRLKTGENSEIWADLRKAHQSFLLAMRKGDQDEAGRALSALGNLINSGSDVETTWSELFEAIERKTVVAGREWKRLSDLQQLMTLEDTMMLITAIMGSVKRHVTSAKQRQQIALDLNLLLNKSATRRPDADIEF